jgi:hypothetical protein
VNVKSQKNLEDVCADQRTSTAIGTVDHPSWCDRARCTATPAATTGQAHRSTPANVTADALIGRLSMTASLIQAHARWLTTPYVAVEFVGLEHDWEPVRGAVELTPEGAGKLGRFLSELADTAEVDHAAQVAAYLSTLGEGVRS